MATNFYFNNFNNSMEQMLLQDLVVESIKIYGNDMYYLPRINLSSDSLYLENDIKEYRHAIPIEMYIRSVDGFEGDGTFLSKFNVEIRDEITLSVALKTFQDEVTTVEQSSIQTPRAGDLIYFPTANRMFQISFVNEKPIFFQLGSVPFYDLKCHMFEYSGEIFQTGVSVIDGIMDQYAASLLSFTILTQNSLYITDESGYPLLNESSVDGVDADVPLDDSAIIEQEADTFLDFSESDPFTEGTY
jgi:Virus neck protein